MLPGNLPPDMMRAMVRAQLDDAGAQLALAGVVLSQMQAARVQAVTFTDATGKAAAVPPSVAVVVLMGHACAALGIERQVTLGDDGELAIVKAAEPA